MKNTNLVKNFNRYIIVCLIILCAPAVFFIIRFYNYEWGNSADWGTFGSFYGGILSPVVAVIVVFLTLWSLKNNEKDRRYKERKKVYENLLNCTTKIKSVISDYLAANSLFNHDTTYNKENNFKKPNDEYDFYIWKIERDMRSFCGDILKKISESKSDIENFAEQRIFCFESFNYKEAKCNELLEELKNVENGLKNGLSGNFAKINDKLMDKVEELLPHFISEIKKYIENNQD